MLLRRLSRAPITTLLAAFAISFLSSARSMADSRVDFVDEVWSAHPVNFAITASDERVFVAYYDAGRRLTVASRDARGGGWRYRKLDVVTDWDSHDYLAMALDTAGHLHVSGNMHNDPLVYFRSAKPGDIDSLERVPLLVDASRERRMTYPVFLEDREGRLVYKYRDGGSGNGNEVYDVFEPASRRWSTLLASPLVDGERQRNAYFVGPVLGPDGFFHLAWVWRETPDAETNHDLSYARSRNLVDWETSGGAPLTLPITLARAEIVDPVPVGAGMINNNTVPGFDDEGRVVIAYHKFDARGDTQIFLARREANGWRIAQLTDWRGFRWDFRGRGSLDFRVSIAQGAHATGHGRFMVQVQRDGETLDLLVNSKSLDLVRESRGLTLADRVREHFRIRDGMVLHAVSARGPHGTEWVLAWPTLPPNRDLPRETIPAPTDLKLIELPPRH